MSQPAKLESTRYLDAIVNQWLHLGRVGWMTKIEGFSMLTETEFGAFSPVSSHRSGRWIGDTSTGIKLRANSVKNCRVLGDSECSQIQFCLSMQSEAELLVSKSSRDAALCPVLDRIKQTFGLDGTSCSIPWLDEWDELPEPCRNCPIACFQAANQISNWRQVTITIETEDLSIQTNITPTWADRDGTVLRMFDSRTQQAIYIDLTTPTLSIESNSDRVGTLKLISPTLN